MEGLYRVKKAVIPAAGLGTRMLPLTRAQPKEMLPVVHKPVIQYVVEEAYRSGIRAILIITGYHKRSLEDHFDRVPLSFPNNSFLEELETILEELDIYFVRQRGQKGLGDAVKYAESFVDGEVFALLLGDNILFPSPIKAMIRLYSELRAPIIAIEKLPPREIPKHGIVSGEKVGEDLILVNQLVEKPDIESAPSNLGIIGRYILTPDIFSYLDKTPPGYGGEVQLTDALSKLLKEKKRLYGFLYNGKRYDIGNKLDWLRANLEIAVRDPLLGQEFRRILREIVNEFL